MQPRALLQALRDGDPLPADAVRGFAQGVGDGTVSDAQIGAFTMGVCQTGLTADARVALTTGMRDSGLCLDWDLPGPVLDKHSTGGVGDAVSLLLAPMLAECGAFIPMISGRGLGHTGGTLDKLEAIPGVQTDLSLDRFRKIVGDVGCAIVAANPEIAPADQRMYAVRDVTGTVRSVDLITSSILSKKLAAGLGALVLDVKVGSGAVMQDMAAARALAQSLVETANGAGCPTAALITDMNQPLLSALGNAVEIAAVMQAFKSGKGRLVDVAIELGAQVLCLGGVASGEAQARAMLNTALTSGAAVDRFGKMIAAQGGPANFVDRWQDYLDLAPMTAANAKRSGFITEIDGTKLGQLVVQLGGGRQTENDQIDMGVGLAEVVSLGQKIAKNQLLAQIHARTDADVALAKSVIESAITIGSNVPELPPLIHERITQ